jgi:hypothetical protein
VDYAKDVTRALAWPPVEAVRIENGAQLLSAQAVTC